MNKMRGLVRRRARAASGWRTAKSDVELTEQLGNRHAMMRSKVLEDFMHRANLNGPMIWNGDVVLAVPQGSQDDVRAGLPVDAVAKSAQRPHQLHSRAVARDFHSASTSSRTKCNRMILGREGASAK